MDRFYHLIEAVVSVNRTPVSLYISKISSVSTITSKLEMFKVALHKAEEAKTRLGCELAPRLAAGRVSLETFSSVFFILHIHCNFYSDTLNR